MKQAKIFYGHPDTGKRKAANRIATEMGDANIMHLNHDYFLSHNLLSRFPESLKAYQVIVVDDCPKDCCYEDYAAIIKKGLPISNNNSVAIAYHRVQLIFLSNYRPSDIPKEQWPLFKIRRFTKTWFVEKGIYEYKDYSVNLNQLKKSIA